MPRTAVPQRKLHCPACRTLRSVREVAAVRVNGRRHSLVQCGEGTCELIWATRVRAR